MATFYEFFAGGGMARAGLGANWQCLFANDFDDKKATSYAANWGAEHLRVCDVATLTAADLPGYADLAWASFPCQDLSLAGNGAGLKGERSDSFWPFWKLMRQLAAEGRAPRMVALENVCGLLSSHGGRDFAALGDALAGGGWRFGAVVVNAAHFLPQSRPRLFIIAVRGDLPVPRALMAGGAEAGWHPAALVKAHSVLSQQARDAWIWWRLPQPANRREKLADLIEDEPQGVAWHTEEETKKLLGMMSALNMEKVEVAKMASRRQVGTVYKRTRIDGACGQKGQRAEVRFDGIAGCLRTPVGGSSRQTIMVIENGKVRSRLLSPREVARLMGLPDNYILPDNYNDAYYLAGDGVAVPAVRFLAQHVMEPILAMALRLEKEAA